MEKQVHIKTMGIFARKGKFDQRGVELGKEALRAKKANGKNKVRLHLL